MIVLRPALESDREFSRLLHHACYRDVVERQFGSWDEELQDRFFADGWIPGKSQIVEREGLAVGVFRRTIFADHIFIHEIQIHHDAQKQGIGSHILRGQMKESRLRGVPLRLQALRVNRARGLYSRFGFRETGENEHSVFMEWREDRGDVS